ncbi:MAG: hypothetical protein ABI298_03820 [Acidimicrobiales bacterium]
MSEIYGDEHAVANSNLRLGAAAPQIATTIGRKFIARHRYVTSSTRRCQLHLPSRWPRGEAAISIPNELQTSLRPVLSTFD